MAKVTTFKKSIWRRIDDESNRFKKAASKKAKKIKKSLNDPETQAKIGTAVKWGAGAVLFLLKVRKELRPTLAEIERHKRNYTYYDPHTHIRFEVRRKLSASVKNEILERTSRGERAYDILKEKRLIK